MAHLFLWKQTAGYGIYEYDNADGQHISSASDYSYHTLQDVSGTQGNTVKLLYNPKKPTEFILPEEQAAFKAIDPSYYVKPQIQEISGLNKHFYLVNFWQTEPDWNEQSLHFMQNSP